MFFKLLSAEIIGLFIGLLLGGLGLLLGGGRIFHNKYFLSLVFIVLVINGLFIFKMVT